jgi:light-regulated signal transduction histidine kinase (bacteriophytochrome)
MSTLAELVNHCEQEQLHLSGAIQAWGALIRFDAQGKATHASANLADFIGITPTAAISGIVDWNWLLGTPTSLPADPGAQIQRYGVHEPNDGHLDIRLIRDAQGGILAELERTAPNDGHVIDLHGLQRPLMHIPDTETGLTAYYTALLDGIFALTGFDRLMIYRFHEDWSGEVVAEKTTPTLGSYLQLRFPASDIPAIARQLYLLNPCRHIPDARADSVPLMGRENNQADLTHTDLRSVSPVHLVYLGNMGVGASFSLPIRVAGKLWGLVACHHRVPHSLSAARRQACTTLVSAFSLGLSSWLASRRMQMVDSLDRRVDKILEAIAQYPHPLDGIELSGQALIDALGAEGFALAVGDEIVLVGNTPHLDEMGPIDAWFMERWQESLFATDRLSDTFSDNPLLLAVASGLMAIKANSPRSGWVRFYWFRPEEPYSVTWAGNPNKPMTENAGVVMLSPRRSFEKWVEVRTGYSRPWSDADRMTAAKFRNTLLRWL